MGSRAVRCDANVLESGELGYELQATSTIVAMLTVAHVSAPLVQDAIWNWHPETFFFDQSRKGSENENRNLDREVLGSWVHC